MKKLLLLLLLIIINPAFPAEKFPAKVVKVIDGDTLIVQINGTKEKVRLIGIDTPESRLNRRAKWQSRDLGRNVREIVKLGKEAKRFVRSTVKRGDAVYLELDIQPRDRYGRILAYVWLENGEMLNKKIICSGYAVPLTIPPNVKYAEVFRECFRKAREEGLGLWK